jgi:transportin-3
LKYDYHQIPEAELPNLKDALLGSLMVSAQGAPVLRLHICTAIAVLGLQWKDWDAVIPDVVAACGSSPESLDVLLQFLAVLPEEAYDSRRGVLSVYKLWRRNNSC